MARIKSSVGGFALALSEPTEVIAHAIAIRIDIFICSDIKSRRLHPAGLVEAPLQKEPPPFTSEAAIGWWWIRGPICAVPHLLAHLIDRTFRLFSHNNHNLNQFCQTSEREKPAEVFSVGGLLVTSIYCGLPYLRPRLLISLLMRTAARTLTLKTSIPTRLKVTN
jgi:hypothetical protein